MLDLKPNSDIKIQFKGDAQWTVSHRMELFCKEANLIVDGCCSPDVVFSVSDNAGC